MGLTDILTFGLALLAYAALNLALWATFRPMGPAAGSRGHIPGQAHLLWLALLTGAHVACVWHFRLAWDVGAAPARGLPVFLCFHGAAALLLILPFVARRRGAAVGPVLIVAWLLVAPSATPAPFVHRDRIEGLMYLALPVTLLSLAGAWVLLRAWRLRVHARRKASA